jgi:glutamate-1-semialdehyde 2,1-aminomutase
MPVNVPLLPGGYGRANYVVGDSAPIVSRGSGYTLYDDRGGSWVDLNNNFTSLIHGHAHPAVVDAATGAIGRGASFGLPNQAELDHARALVGRIGWADQVRYTNSGTEAVMTAVRVARAATGRDKVIIQRPAYHGTSTTVLPALSDAARRGVPNSVAGEILTIATGSEGELLEAVQTHRDDIAAVLIDLMPTRGGLEPVSQAFLQLARDLCDDVGAYLVVDEVISFRLALGGWAFGRYGIEPDLMVLGKLIGGGLPIGAVVGPEPMMRVLNPLLQGAIPHGGTFSANPVSMNAGIATLEHFTEEEITRINALGDRLRNALAPHAARHRWVASGRGSLLSLLPEDGNAADVLRLWWTARERGVLITPVTGLMCISTPMREQLVDEVADALVQSLDALAA